MKCFRDLCRLRKPRFSVTFAHYIEVSNIFFQEARAFAKIGSSQNSNRQIKLVLEILMTTEITHSLLKRNSNCQYRTPGTALSL